VAVENLWRSEHQKQGGYIGANMAAAMAN